MPQTQMGVVRWVANPSIIVARILPADDAELSNPAWTKFIIPGNPPLELVRVARPAITLVGQTRIFLYGMTDPVSMGPKLGCTFPDPGNWNKGANRIEAIGAGQPGWPGYSESGGGGGGGAYGFGVNVPTTLPTGYTVWPMQGAPYAGLVTIWGSFAYSGAGPGIQGPGVVYAELAYGGQNSAPGVGGSQVYPTGFSGGNGGNGIIGPLNTPGGGGGGAAGPSGAGGNGGAATTTQFGAGGNANNNSVLGGFPASGNGHTGTEWGSIAGCGSGGAGSISTISNGGAGAVYGGGGGGGARGVGPETTATLAGGGGDGLIVITYTPLPAGMQAQMQA